MYKLLLSLVLVLCSVGAANAYNGPSSHGPYSPPGHRYDFYNHPPQHPHYHYRPYYQVPPSWRHDNIDPHRRNNPGFYFYFRIG